jgi:hypothetical protein
MDYLLVTPINIIATLINPQKEQIAMYKGVTI